MPGRGRVARGVGAACSPRAHALCPPFIARSYFRARIRWEAAGRIGADCWVSALPVSSFSPAALRTSGSSRQRLAAALLLAVLVASRVTVLARHLLRKLRQGSQQAGAGGSPSAQSRTHSWLLRRMGSRGGSPRRPSLLAAAVTDRLLMLDLITSGLMLLALVLLSAALAAEQNLELRADYKL